ncbi:MAG: hypothetical protein UDB11_03730 [Peptococcaceae bacterium]|nr:hypothetical protein [Peptococcaceae bacterium]
MLHKQLTMPTTQTHLTTQQRTAAVMGSRGAVAQQQIMAALTARRAM